MTGLTYAAYPATLPESTLTELFFRALDEHADGVAFQRMVSAGTLTDIGMREVSDAVKRVAAALDALGFARGDRAGILSENRPEWPLTDYGCLCAGLIDVPIYPTSTPVEVAYVLRGAGARLVFVSNGDQAAKVLTMMDAGELPELERVVVFDAPAGGDARLLPWPDFLEAGRERAASWSDDEFRRRALQARPSDVATIIFTSGTSGDPKGVMLTHNNVSSNVEAACRVLRVESSDNAISFLPLSHILQRMVDFLLFRVGCRIAYPRSLDTLSEDLAFIAPTVAVSVPRIYEKIYNRVMDARGMKKTLVGWAASVADAAADVRLAGREPTGVLALKYRLADALVFSKVRQAVGGRARIFVSGGGPLSPILCRFFYSIGLPVFEGYGLTETSPVTNLNTPDHFRIGTVGKPVPGTEIKIAEDGEILVRGPQVMRGYYANPEATAQAISEDGWFATGDIGVIDDDGFLSITDRKKDIIVTAGGKNIAPQPIENRLKTHPLIEQAIMVGDRRKYVSLLVVPAFEALGRWAGEQGIEWASREELVSDARVKSHMESEVLAMLQDLARVERPKKLALLTEELTIENGFLTPSLKVKRRVVQERLEGLIDSLYADEAADATEMRSR